MHVFDLEADVILTIPLVGIGYIDMLVWGKVECGVISARSAFWLVEE